jgi:stress response protein YsnF
MTDDNITDHTSVMPAREAAEVVRSEERLDVTTHTEVVGRVRVAKRVVTEERLITVSVRREELVVEELPVDPDHVPDGLITQRSGAGPDGTRTVAPAVEMWLSEEQVEVVTRTVPKERVRVFVDTETDLVDVAGTVAKEVVEVDGHVVTHLGG